MKRRAGIGTLCVLISKIYEPVTFHFHLRFEKNIPISLIELVVESYNKTPLRNFESTSSNPDDSSLFAGYFVSVSTCFSRLSSNWRQFLFNYRLAFSFFFILVLPLPLIFLRVTHSKVVLHLFISFLSNLRVRFLRDVHSIRSLFPPLFVIVFLSLIYLRFIFPLLVRFFYIYIYVSGYRGANRIPVWQTRLIFWKGRIFAKNRQNAVAIVD